MPEYPYTEPKQELRADRRSICPKCFHYKVCRGTANQPCVKCNQFIPVTVPLLERHARWVRLDERRGSYRFYCSACGGMAYFVHGQNSRTKKEPFCGYPLCPHCGAAMDEEART